MPDQTKVTVNVRDDVLQEIQALASSENKTVTEIINEGLRIRALGRDHRILLEDRDGSTSLFLL